MTRSTCCVLAVLGGVAIAVSGCQNSGKPRRSTAVQDSSSQVGEGEADRPVSNAYRDPVARASLRERALAVLASSATNGLPEERANAIEGLTTTPGRLYPQIQRGVVDPVVGVRSVAAMAVGRAKLQAASDLVRPLLTDPAPEVRMAAMYALHQVGESVDLTPIATLMMTGNIKVRSQAAFLLGEMGDPSALGLLRDAGRGAVSKSGPADVRLFDLQVAEARIKLGDDGPLQDVRAALFPARPEDLEATALACQILGQVRDKASANRMIALIKPQDDSNKVMPAEIRLAAAAALARLGQPHGSPLAGQYRGHSSDALRSQAAFVLGETGRIENLPVLEGMMGDSVGRVRVAAAAAIVRITESDGSLEGIGQTGGEVGLPGSAPQ